MLRVGRKSEMQRPRTVMAGDRAAGKGGGIDGGAAPENEKNAARTSIIGDEAAILEHGFEAHHLFVELFRASHVADINRGFQHARELRHLRPFCYSPHYPMRLRAAPADGLLRVLEPRFAQHIGCLVQGRPSPRKSIISSTGLVHREKAAPRGKAACGFSP